MYAFRSIFIHSLWPINDIEHFTGVWYNLVSVHTVYTERKERSWFLIFFEMVSDSFVIKYKVRFCDSCTHKHLLVWNTRANSVTHTLQGCDCYTRDSFAWMFESCLLPTFITNVWTKNCVLWIVDGSKKLSGNMWLFMG